MFKRILIANRGEIAVRIIRTLRDLGIESVVVYSESDKNSLATRMADLAIPLAGISSADTYLNIEKLIQAIKDSKAEAVHPGYGFLSENADFAAAVEKAGAVFIGPTPEAIRNMGDKVTAKAIMQKHDVPTVPGSPQALQSLDELKQVAANIGFPLILKAAAGGGGRGMRVVKQESELEDALAACQREAQAYFSNPAVFCEKYIESPRHIEFQILFDQHGHGVHLFERDCSIQRRHQKLVEEAPSQYLNAEQRAQLGEIALRAARAVNYRGAGTVEFICNSPDEAYFMEMNTRIQVEHPVTEAITGVDLIEQQIRVAAGEPLALKQEDIHIHGWSIECRINAEDPSDDFRPQPGTLDSLHFPQGPHLRIDSYLEAGATIPESYDSMVAKYIVWGPTREQAIQRMLRAFAETKISGIPTTIKFHEALFKNHDFQASAIDTHFIERHYEQFKQLMSTSDQQELGSLLACLLIQSQQSARPTTAEQKPQWQQASLREGVNP